KTDPIDQLSRITASNVVNIEIIDGASLDIPGLSGQVANIKTSTKGISGTWEWRPEFRKRLKPNWFNSEATLSGKKGNLDYSLKLREYGFRGGVNGPEQLTTPNGELFEIRDEDAQRYANRPGISLNLTYKPQDGHIANFNADYNLFEFNGRDISKRVAITPQGENLQTIFHRGEDEKYGEFSGDYEFPFAKGKLKLIGLYQFEKSPTETRFEVFDETGLIESTRFEQSADETETIIRSEYSWSPKSGGDWQIGLEGAFNILDIESQFLERDVLGAFIGDPIEMSKVKEDRGEASITHSRTLSSKWDLQASISGEYSKLIQNSQTDGDSTIDMNSRTFFRPKGFVTATYKSDDSFSIRGKIEREVGQLNFFDFISSVSLEDNLNQTGNPDIVPDQTWRGEIEFDKDFGSGNTFKAQFYGELISDIVDRIPVGIDGDAVGNINQAHRYGVDFSATVKGDKWGLKGTQIDAELQLRDSSVKDPLLGFSRRLNSDKKMYYSVDFRHDIPNTNWAYGVFLDRYIESDVYRLTAQQEFVFTKPFTILYVEHKDIAGMKVKVSAMNLLNAHEDFTRVLYDTRRDFGQITHIETRSRDFKPFLRLSVSGTF
ncbi:MAG: hypothetical protein ACPGVT_09495, partial [Maricaulaceae bacterium]